MPRFAIHHLTKYTYEAPVRDSANQIVLFPIRDDFQELINQEIQITGEPDVDIFRDYYGNQVGSFMNAEPHTELLIDSKLQVVTRSRPMPAEHLGDGKAWDHLESMKNLVPYIDFLYHEQFDALPDLTAEINSKHFTEHSILHAAKELNAYVYSHFKYIKGITNVETTLDEVWTLKAGVCQDFAHVLLVMLRILSIPARYVSGYICPNKNGMRGEGATHAWVEAYIPEYGWLGLDPTNNCYVNDLHVRLAVGRSFSDCSPVKGTYKGISNHSLEVGVSVSYEDGRTVEDSSAILRPQPTTNGKQENSYRRYMEMMQQQQQ